MRAPALVLRDRERRERPGSAGSALRNMVTACSFEDLTVVRGCPPKSSTNAAFAVTAQVSAAREVTPMTRGTCAMDDGVLPSRPRQGGHKQHRRPVIKAISMRWQTHGNKQPQKIDVAGTAQHIHAPAQRQPRPGPEIQRCIWGSRPKSSRRLRASRRRASVSASKFGRPRRIPRGVEPFARSGHDVQDFWPQISDS